MVVEQCANVHVLRKRPWCALIGAYALIRMNMVVIFALYFQITCALKEMFLVEETEEQVAKIYHRLFAALMVRMGASVGLEPLKKQEPVSCIHVFVYMYCA